MESLDKFLEKSLDYIIKKSETETALFQFLKESLEDFFLEIAGILEITLERY